MSFHSKNTKKGIILTEEYEEDFKIIIICRFCKKKSNESDEVRYHCHLTGEYRGPAHGKQNFIVTQDESNFIHFLFHNFGNYDCNMFFKKLVDEKNGNVEFKIIPKTNEEDVSVNYG